MLFGLAKSIITQPKLLVFLFAGYKNIVIQELRGLIRAMKILFILYGLSLFFVGLGTLSCIGSLLLWAALPFLNSQNAWLLVVMPIMFFMMGFVFYISGNRLKVRLNLLELRKKIKLNTEHICKSLSQ